MPNDPLQNVALLLDAALCAHKEDGAKYIYEHLSQQGKVVLEYFMYCLVQTPDEVNLQVDQLFKEKTGEGIIS